jgi:hypothetical protein
LIFEARKANGGETHWTEAGAYPGEEGSLGGEIDARIFLTNSVGLRPGELRE